MISLVIPHMPSMATDPILDQCLESFKGQYDELILISNEGMGYGPAVNLGLKYSSGDYLVVSNNDITLLYGTLRHLQDHRGVVVPVIEPEPRDYKPRSIFCMPRWVYEEILERDGFFYDPAFEVGYFEDDDLYRRMFYRPQEELRMVREIGVKVNHLNGGGLTMKQMGEQRWYDINQKVFNEKWS